MNSMLQWMLLISFIMLLNICASVDIEINTSTTSIDDSTKEVELQRNPKQDQRKQSKPEQKAQTTIPPPKPKEVMVLVPSGGKWNVTDITCGGSACTKRCVGTICSHECTCKSNPVANVTKIASRCSSSQNIRCTEICFRNLCRENCGKHVSLYCGNTVV